MTKKVKTEAIYRHKLMRPSMGIMNLPKIFVACFGHEICFLNGTFSAKNINSL